ncbi:MAG TPA: AAA family ATPase, partial [Verrucomicrobiae bacterium]|nr:AAA family ATPase [Verrucomicrobiae bacterium]
MLMLDRFRTLLLLVALALAVTGYSYIGLDRTLGPEELSSSRFQRLLWDSRVVSAQVEPNALRDIYSIKGEFKRSSGGKSEFRVTAHLSEWDLQKVLSLSRAQLSLPQTGTSNRFWDILPTIVISVIILGLLVYHQRVGQGKSKHRIRQRPTVRFADVAGVEEAKAEVQEVIDFLRDPNKYNKLGGALPKGILLIGPPGTGKTLLAKAIAGEANANFFSASGSDFSEIYVGVGAKRIRELFAQARRARPAIIFIDEIDCLGKNRKHDQNGELQQTNNALLTAMDGFDSSEGVIVVAATNRPEDLDEAIMRPGRFDRKVHVPLPDQKGRRAILSTHSRKNPINAIDHALNVIAQTTPGMSGAELANLLNEAAILSAQRAKKEITLSELEEARDKVRWGKERKSMALKQDERQTIAYHEAGHAVVGLQCPQLPPIHRVSIIPRGQSLGSVTTLPREDQNIHSKQFLLQQLAMLMGGRASEEHFLGDMTNGANGDLDSAKSIARRMIHDWGMGQKLYYELNKQDAEREINELLTNAMRKAREVVASKHALVECIAQRLLVDDMLTREQVLELEAR